MEKTALDISFSIFRCGASRSSSGPCKHLLGTAPRQNLLSTLYQQQYWLLFIIQTSLRPVTRGVFTPASVPKSYARTPARRQGLPNGLITISIIVMDHLLVRWKTFWCGFDIPCVHRPLASRPTSWFWNTWLHRVAVAFLEFSWFIGDRQKFRHSQSES